MSAGERRVTSLSLVVAGHVLANPIAVDQESLARGRHSGGQRIGWRDSQRRAYYNQRVHIVQVCHRLKEQRWQAAPVQHGRRLQAWLATTGAVENGGLGWCLSVLLVDVFDIFPDQLAEVSVGYFSAAELTGCPGNGTVNWQDKLRWDFDMIIQSINVLREKVLETLFPGKQSDK